MKLFTTYALTLLFATSALADQKDDVLKALAKASSLLEMPGKFALIRAQTWEKAVDNVQGLLGEKPDKGLKDGYMALADSSNRLINSFKISSSQCIGADEFEKVEKAASESQSKLKKATFILAGKRATREVLVKLADYIVGAAKIGASRGQICKGLDTFTSLRQMQAMGNERDELLAGANKEALEYEAKIRAEVAQAVKALDIEKEYILKRQKTLEDIKGRAEKKAQDIVEALKELGTLNESLQRMEKYLAKLPEESRLLIYMAYRMTGGNELEAKAEDLKTQIEKDSRTLANLSKAISRIDDLIAKKVADPHFERDRKKAEDAALEASKDYLGIRQTIEEKTKELVTSTSNKASQINKDYDAKAKAACGIDKVTVRAVEDCGKKAAKSIRDAAPGARLVKQCGSLGEKSGLVDVSACAEAAGNR